MTPKMPSPAAGRRTLLSRIPAALATSLTLTAAVPTPGPDSPTPTVASVTPAAEDRPGLGGDVPTLQEYAAETFFVRPLGLDGESGVPTGFTQAGEPETSRSPDFSDLPGPNTSGSAIEPGPSYRPNPGTGPEQPGRAETGAYVDPTSGRPSAASVLRRFDKPAQNWLPGHRGVDLSLPVGAEVLAAGNGTVAFAGVVAGTPVISIDHPDGIRTTYQPVFAHLSEGDQVITGAVVGRLANPVDEWPGLHWGARVGEEYLNPLELLSAPVIRLKPVNSPDTGGGLVPGGRRGP